MYLRVCQTVEKNMNDRLHAHVFIPSAIIVPNQPPIFYHSTTSINACFLKFCTLPLSCSRSFQQYLSLSNVVWEYS